MSVFFVAFAAFQVQNVYLHKKVHSIFFCSHWKIQIQITCKSEYTMFLPITNWNFWFLTDNQSNSFSPTFIRILSYLIVMAIKATEILIVFYKGTLIILNVCLHLSSFTLSQLIWRLLRFNVFFLFFTMPGIKTFNESLLSKVMLT